MTEGRGDCALSLAQNSSAHLHTDNPDAKRRMHLLPPFGPLLLHNSCTTPAYPQASCKVEHAAPPRQHHQGQDDVVEFLDLALCTYRENGGYGDAGVGEGERVQEGQG